MDARLTNLVPVIVTNKYVWWFQISAMVEIYLSDNVAEIFLSVPLSDVKRLAIRPFKWLRFVMFCICGARGDLSATPDGPPVNYDTDIASFADATYYYKARGERFSHSRCLYNSIFRGIHLCGPQLFKRANDFYWAPSTPPPPPRFQNGRHATRWGALRHHSNGLRCLRCDPLDSPD